MKNAKVLMVVLAFLLSYASPVFVTKADTGPLPILDFPLQAPESGFTTLRLRITAYSSSVDETDDTPTITASGMTVRDGIVATNVLPLGTKIMIPALFGNKIFEVEDRMNKRFQGSVDIWMTSKAKALYFGVHYADIVVLNGLEALSLR